MSIPSIFLNPKFWILANMAMEAAIIKVYSNVEGKSEAELDEMIIKNRAEIDAEMEEMRKK